MSTIAPTLDAASPKRRAISPPSLAAAAAAPAAGVAVRRHGWPVHDVDRRGDDERDYETVTGHTRRGLHHCGTRSESD